MERLNNIKLEKINVKNSNNKEIRKYILLYNSCIDTIIKSKIEYNRYIEGIKNNNSFYDNKGLFFYKSKIIESINQLERLKKII